MVRGGLSNLIHEVTSSGSAHSCEQCVGQSLCVSVSQCDLGGRNLGAVGFLGKDANRTIRVDHMTACRHCRSRRGPYPCPATSATAAGSASTTSPQCSSGLPATKKIGLHLAVLIIADPNRSRHVP